MKSRFESKCKHCNKTIKVGDDIRPAKDGKYYHWDCASNVDAKVVVKSAESSKPFVPSHRQQAIFNFAQYRKDHLIIKAVAGSGKSTTLVKLLELLPTRASKAFFAFNRNIVEELSTRVPIGTKVKTFHSHGLHALYKLMPNLQLDEHNTKMTKIAAEIIPIPEDLPMEQRRTLRQKRSWLLDVVAMVRCTATDIHDTAAINKVIDHYGIEVGDFREELVRWTPRVVDECVRLAETICFADMIDLALRLKAPFAKYDIVLVDEAQDLNVAQHLALQQSLNPGGRMFIVGDPQQAIYGFSGALSDSMDILKEQTKAAELPLDICYRCPSSHLDLARAIVPEIQDRPNCPEGTIETYDISDFADKVLEGDVVLCRLNAPLVRKAMQCIAKQQKATVLGRDIGHMLADFSERFAELLTIDAYVQAFENYRETEVVKMTYKLMAESSISIFKDKIDAVLAVADFCKKPKEVPATFRKIFADKGAGRIFTSVHKFKGGEADRVHVLGPELMPFFAATQEWEVQQEFNLKYVALTRSKEYLSFVSLKSTKDNSSEPKSSKKG